MYGKTRPNSCQVNVRNSMEFSLYIGYNDVDCDVRQEIPGRFASDIVIQHHDMIVTGADVGLKVRMVMVAQFVLGASRVYGSCFWVDGMSRLT